MRTSNCFCSATQLTMLVLLLGGCASFNSLMATSRFSEAQQHLTTYEEFSRLVQVYDLKSSLIHLRHVDEAQVLNELAPYDKRPETINILSKLMRTKSFFTIVSDISDIQYNSSFRLRSSSSVLLSTRTDSITLSKSTGEATPEDCRSEIVRPMFPTAAELMNLLFRKVSISIQFQEQPYPVTKCPSKYDDARIAPLATALGSSLDLNQHRKLAGLPLKTMSLGNSTNVVLGIKAGQEATSFLIVCAAARSYEDKAQFAIRYEANLGALQKFFQDKPKAVPLGEFPWERSIVFVSSDTTFFDGDSDSAVDCLVEPFQSPIGPRITTLKATRRERTTELASTYLLE